jgi:hypothetical protein
MTVDRPQVTDIEDAIHFLLTDYVQQRKNPRGASHAEPRIITVADVMAADDDRDLYSLTTDPLRTVLRRGIRDLAQHLFNAFDKAMMEGGDGAAQAMQDACYRIAGRDPDNEGMRGDILDKIWDGVGNDHWRWWA